MALRLVELLVDRQAAQAAQLLIEYDPQPPFDSGALAKADDATVAQGQRIPERPAVTASRLIAGFFRPASRPVP